MAAIVRKLIFCVVFLTNFASVYLQTTILYHPLQTKDDCKTLPSDNYHQYYDTVNLKCSDCRQTSQLQTVSTDGYNCVCTSTNKYAWYFGGKQTECEACGAGTDCSLPANPSCLVFPCSSCPPETLVGGLCFDTTCLVPSASFSIPLTSGAVESQYLQEQLRAAHSMCKCYGNSTACQALGNMCTLLYNEITAVQGQACYLLTEAPCPCNPTPTKPSESELDALTPMVYLLDDADRILDDINILTTFTFNPESLIKFRAAKYSLDGEFLGMKKLTGGLLQLCPDTESRMNAAYMFGTYYEQSCQISALDFWDQARYPLEFYDLYIEFTGLDGVQQLHYVPILNENLKNNGREVNKEAKDEGITYWRFTTRLFLVDNVATIPTQGAGASTPSTIASSVRFLSSVKLTISLQPDGTGQIYTPFFTVAYGEVSREDALSGTKVDVSFSVEYEMDEDKYNKDFQIAVGTLSTLAILYAGYRSYVWSRRAGRLSIDFPTIANFVFLICGALSHTFFVISFGIAFYFLTFFKGQDTVFLVLPIGRGVREFLGLLGAAFAMKTLHIGYLLVVQCSTDLFIIDWERPRGVITSSTAEGKKGRDAPVSIWRTYFVANEWNEIQTLRKINKTFQVFAVVFFLNVVGFENVCTMDPDGSVTKSISDYQASHHFLFRYAIATSVYILVGVVQWIFFTFVYERFIEDAIGQFVDLCSMSNISLFIMQHAQYGYYIHGRSVHGNADTGMREMSEKMRREEEGKVGERGLLPNTDHQTFIMSLPKKLRHKYEIIFQPVQLESAQAASRMEEGKGLSGKLTEKSIEAYRTINKFFMSFIDHAYKDTDYVVHDKTFLEGILDTEFLDPNDKGVFYKDNGHAFDNVLLYGHEMSLLIFDILLFNIVDLIARNFILAGILTYLLNEFIYELRDSRGRKNLANKTLVDERFLI